MTADMFCNRCNWNRCTVLNWSCFSSIVHHWVCTAHVPLCFVSCSQIVSPERLWFTIWVSLLYLASPTSRHESCSLISIMMSLGVFRQEQLKCCWREGGRMVASFFGKGVLLADAMSSLRVFGPMPGRWVGERCLYRVWAVQLSFCVDYSRRREFEWVCKWACVSKPVICDSMIEQIICPCSKHVAHARCRSWAHSRFFQDLSSPLLSSPLLSSPLLTTQTKPQWQLCLMILSTKHLSTLTFKGKVSFFFFFFMLSLSKK